VPKSSNRVEANDRNAQFLRLLSQNELRLVACVHALVPHWSDAEDLLQESRVRLWEQFDEFQPGSDFGAWACTVARYMVQAYYKRTSRQPLAFSDEVLEAISVDLDEVLEESDERLAALVQCVRGLNTKNRDLLHRCYFEGKRIKQVAADLGRPLAATDEQFAALQNLLKSKPDARRLYAEYLHASLSLPRVLAGLAPSEDASTSIAEIAVDRPQPRRAAMLNWLADALPAGLDYRVHPARFWSAIWTITLASWALLFAFVMPWWRGGEPPDAGQPGPPMIVAQLLSTRDCQWSEGAAALTDGNLLRRGQRIEIDAGLVEIAFHSGAKVLVEGPARFTLDGLESGSLGVGRLLAHVPVEASGFLISAPVAEIVDLGTEFGVAVERSGAAEIHVLVGSVAVQPNDENRGSRRTVLTAGEALAIPAGANSQPVRSPADARKFVRQMPDPPPTELAIFQQGVPEPFTGKAYAGVEDVQLLEWASGANFGMRDNFDVGNAVANKSARTLLRFDLSALAGKYRRLRSATLRLHVTSQKIQNWGRVEVYRLADANADWRQGTHIGGARPVAAAGDATWTRRQHAGAPWAGDYGAGKPGVDFLERPLAARHYTADTQGEFTLRLVAELSFLEAWIAGETNAGFYLREANEDLPNRINFYSSEAPNISLRPELVIEYEPVEPGKDSLPGNDRTYEGDE
jgi:RNA polymerase sigma-70 factor (ECF subfamily)